MTRDRAVGIGLAVLAIEQLALAAYMAFAPASFFARIGPFGVLNEHYVRDVATFTAALGIVALIAVRREAWRAPVLAVAGAQYLLHTVNHAVDAGEADPRSTGVILAVGLALATVLLGVGLRLTRRRA